MSAIKFYGTIPISWPRSRASSGTRRRNRVNQEKYGVAFEMAQLAFLDEHRVIAEDLSHSRGDEQRYYCFGMVDDGVMTVRFTWREGRIRIFGAGYWRKGRAIYERENETLYRR